MKAAPALIGIYVVMILILVTVIGFFISILKVYLLKLEKKPKAVPPPEIEGLTAYSLHESLQNQILEIQATDIDRPEHETRFKQLIKFLRDSQVTLKAEASMLNHYAARLEELPHSDMSQLTTFGAIFKWSQNRMKELLGTKV